MDTGDHQPDPRGDDGALWAIRRVLAGVPAELAGINLVLGRLSKLGYVPAGLRPEMEAWTGWLDSCVEGLRTVLGELGKSRFLEMVADAAGELEAQPVLPELSVIRVCSDCPDPAQYGDMFRDGWCSLRWQKRHPRKVEGAWRCWHCGKPAEPFFGGQFLRYEHHQRQRHGPRLFGGVCRTCWDLAHPDTSHGPDGAAASPGVSE